MSATEQTSGLNDRLKSLPLAARLMAAIVFSTVVGVFIAFAVSYPMIRDSLQHQAQAQLSELAHATVESVDKGLGEREVQVPTRLVNTLRAQNISVQYLKPGQVNYSLLTEDDMLALEVYQPVNKDIETDKGELLVAARGLVNGGVLVFTKPTNAIDQFSNQILLRIGLALIVGVAIALLVGVWLSRRLTSGLKQAATAAHRIGQGDRDTVLDIADPPELAELSGALNSLQSDLATSEGRQREFLLSISHEFRTPLTAVQGFSEALSDGVVPPAEVEYTAELIHEESTRLNRLVSDLMDLARLDAVEFRIQPTEIDFVELAAAANDVWVERCQSNGVEFKFEPTTDQIPGRTDPMRIRQVIDNLCENALRMTPQGGEIVLELRPVAQGQVAIEVRDSGPGLTESDAQVAFEPGELYARYQGVRKSGTGVGLALVGRLAARLGGTAQAGSAPEGGARFTILVSRFM